MRRMNQGLQLLLAAVLFLSLCATGAQAALRDFGPINPVGGYPTWYRDNTGIAVQQCLSKAVSPITSLPICNLLPFPNTIPPFDPALPVSFYPNPVAGYNWPLETFYFSLSTDKISFVSPTYPNAKPLILLALEGSFANNINPIPGDQIAFSRVRINLIGFPSGQYTITHPFGVDVMNVNSADIKTQKFTRDAGLAGVVFTGALAGDIGPFLTWTPDPARVAAGTQNADGTIPGLTPVTLVPNGEVYLGDFNLAHTFTGSPFGTNFFRIQGPLGSNIGGGGSDVLLGTLGILEGQKFTAPIPSPLKVDRLTYRRDTISGQIDVFATTSPLSNQATPSSLTITGANIIPASGVVMSEDAATGRFFAHIDNIPPALFPAQVTITNTADVPPTAIIGDLADEVFLTDAAYEPISKTLTIKATSGDLLNVPAPALTADLYGPIPANGTLVVAGVNAPPPAIRVVSAAHGSATKQLLVQAFIPPTVGNDSASILNNSPAASSVVIDVLANDSAIAPATLAPATVQTTAATHGTTSVNPATGAITYTLNPAFVGPGSDAFTYTVADTNGAISLAATVTVTITSANIPPVAVNDTATGTTTGAFNIAVLANDSSATSTLNGNSIVIVTQPAAPASATAGAGTVSFSSTTAGIYSFQYTVNDTTGATSNVATAVVTVTAPAVPPTATADSATVTAGASVVINVAANDVAGTNPINASSVTVAGAPANGTTLTNAGGAGTITYTPNAGFSGIDTFTYTIKDTLGSVSGSATVTVTVNAPSAETITITRAQYTLSSGQWRVDGNTTARVAGQTMKIFNSATVPANATTGLLATITVGGNGTFTWTSPNASPAPNALRRISVLSSLNPNNNKREQVTVTVR